MIEPYPQHVHSKQFGVFSENRLQILVDIPLLVIKDREMLVFFGKKCILLKCSGHLGNDPANF
jgi:hypothetical protein